MTEKRIVVDDLAIAYEGLFNLVELYSLIDSFLKEKGYDKIEKENREIVTAHGKDIFIVLEPEKYYSDYVKLDMKIIITIREVKEVETEFEGVKVRLNQGKVKIVFTGILTTDWEGRWEQTPFYYFLRTVIEKLVYKKQTANHEAEVKNDVMHLMDQVGSFLNLYRYRKSI